MRPYPFDQSVYDIEQFFVMRSHRRSGIGRLAFQKCLVLHPGKWQIRALLDNKPAYKFWERTISETTGQNFTSTDEMDRDLLMHFFRFEYPET
ncbi:GNAT family N-acetyltransferase [Salinicola rhizosphaerae]|uniref:GNAT family N-acetyltransferase n=1 Tax=Salinicola rhizosphaerae TaxID=1443141 RepID=UPI001672543E